eukprot:GHRR01033726.1.p1 GENE.GHRR01033726.1~~GHRR01033726.1.p1  ORF type:complete len:153 (+),score=31.08 GHRR01033726.1:64-522(+)
MLACITCHRQCSSSVGVVDVYWWTSTITCSVSSTITSCQELGMRCLLLTWLPNTSNICVPLAYVANALALNCMTAVLMARMRAVLTRKLLMSVAPTRMGYKLTTRKFSPSRKLPLMATTAQTESTNKASSRTHNTSLIKHMGQEHGITSSAQ